MYPSRLAFEADLVEFLARIYAAVPWRKIRTSKPRWDIWDHRLRQAATRGSLAEFASKLCNHLELQALPAPALELFPRLEAQGQAVLDHIYRAHSVVAALSAARAEEIWEARKGKQLKLEIQEEQD